MNSDSKKRAGRILAEMLNKQIKWLMLVLLLAVFVVLLYPSLIVHSYRYQLGDIAERDIKAPRDFFVEDRAATQASQQLAFEQVLAVYDFDPRIAPQTADRIRSAFSRIRQVAADLDTPVTIVADGDAPPAESLPAQVSHAQEREKALWTHKDEFVRLLGIDISRGAFKLLISEQFLSEVADIIIRINSEILANGVVTNKEIILREVDKGIILRDVSTQTEKTIYALRQYHGLDQAKTMVRIVAEPLVKDLNYNLVNLVVDFCQSLIVPNITFNRNETEERKKQALNNIKPIMYKIKAGEMMLREGERVSPVQLLKLRELERQTGTRQVPFTGMGATILLATLIISVYLLYFHQPRYAGLKTNKNLLLLTITLLVACLMIKLSTTISETLNATSPLSGPAEALVYIIPAAASAMLVCLLLGFRVALAFSLVAAVCATMLLGNRLEMFIFFFVNHSLAAYWVQNCRERKVVITAGIKLGLVNMVLAVAVGIYTADPQGIGLAWDLSLSFLGGLFCSIITVGLAPLVEMAFGYTTDITLLELANLDRPILRQLMLEAPGTYHHCVVVGSMVEAAAAEIGANPLLAKVSGYYHDIGKVKKPPYFIENQAGGRNKHDKLAPSMSSLILIAHVKDGVEIAQKNKLGQVIIDTIQQHHGTSLIHYFYEKARQLKGESAVAIDDFRYPGPKPQTKEAGLVMLADVVEAASRTLENPTPARIQGLVQHLINKVFSDGQLDDCELTLKDLHSIAKSFNNILNGIYHHRIDYLDATTKEPREYSKVKNGNFDRQPADKASPRESKIAKQNPAHLKRLGLS